jgi:recombination protein RecR
MTNDHVEELITCLTKLPGVGKRSAFRLAIHLLQPENKKDALIIAQGIQSAIERNTLCKRCQVFSNKEICNICSTNRSKQLCIISTIKDMYLFESTNSYKGYYFILNNILSKLQKLSLIDDFILLELEKNLIMYQYEELIIGLRFSPETETVNYIIQKIASQHVKKISVLRCGIPISADLEYIDPQTLIYSFEERKVIP